MVVPTEAKISEPEKQPKKPLTEQQEREELIKIALEKHRFRILRECKHKRTPALLMDLLGLNEKQAYHHLRVLKDAGLLRQHEGFHNWYEATERGKLIMQELGI